MVIDILNQGTSDKDRLIAAEHERIQVEAKREREWWVRNWGEPNGISDLDEAYSLVGKRFVEVVEEDGVPVRRIGALRNLVEGGRPKEPSLLSIEADTFLREAAKLWQMITQADKIELALTSLYRDLETEESLRQSSSSRRQAEMGVTLHNTGFALDVSCTSCYLRDGDGVPRAIPSGLSELPQDYFAPSQVQKALEDVGRFREVVNAFVDAGLADAIYEKSIDEAKGNMRESVVHVVVAKDYLERIEERKRVVEELLENKLQPKPMEDMPFVDLGARPYRAVFGEMRVNSNEEQLPATVCRPEGLANPPGVLLLHGSGESYKRDLFRRLQSVLSEQGVASLAVDLVSENTRNDSLEQRLVHAKNSAIELVSSLGMDAKRLAILGSSMGGYLAVRLVESLAGELKFKGLYFSAPAVYGRGAEKLRFGEELRSFLRRDVLSWSDTLAFQTMRGYIKSGGRAVMIIGAQDRTIDPGIQVAWRAVEGLRVYGVSGKKHNLLSSGVKDRPEITARVVSFLAREIAEGLV